MYIFPCSIALLSIGNPLYNPLWHWRDNFEVSVQFRCSVVSDSLQLHGLQHAGSLSPSPTPGAYPNSCPLSWRCHPTISSFVIPFSSCCQSFPASGSFPVSQFFTSGDQSIGASPSASVPLINIQNWFPWRLTGLISLQSKGLSRVFVNYLDIVYTEYFHNWIS